ncbi:MAG: toxin-antitoxin system YwqK family antitoxin [Draconibacterium sp.]
MYKLLVLFIFLPFLSFSQINQTDANGLRQGLWKKTQPNGRPVYEGPFKDGKPVGEWKRYHPGGQVKALIEYRGDTAHTQLFDVWRKKLAEGDFLNEKKTGVWSVFKENQKVADEEYRNGVKDGVSHRYYDTGEVMEESYWENDVQEGDYQVFFKTGEPYMQCKMQNNMRNGLFLVYFENGQQEVVGAYKNNLRHDEWKYYDEDGKYQYSLFYNEGQILNPQVRDSIDSLQMKELEKNKGHLLDPEKFMQDPSEYMMQNKMFR